MRTCVCVLDPGKTGNAGEDLSEQCGIWDRDCSARLRADSAKRIALSECARVCVRGTEVCAKVRERKVSDSSAGN